LSPSYGVAVRVVVPDFKLGQVLISLPLLPQAKKGGSFSTIDTVEVPDKTNRTESINPVSVIALKLISVENDVSHSHSAIVCPFVSGPIL
jgi:hypothetical protein